MRKKNEAIILDGLRQVPNEYRPVAFWFLNHFLREGELRRQIREMADKGFGGIMFHGRDGLRSGYLNGEWRQALAWSVDEAIKHDMDVWLYDELNYPSGPAGKRLFDYFPDTRMKSLELSAVLFLKPGEVLHLDSPECELKYVLAVAPDGGVQEISEGWANGSEHNVTVLALAEKRDMSTAYEFPDYFDKAVMEKFVELSYEWYAKEFGGHFGKTIKGEFTDNSCFNFGLTRRAIPWTADLPARFAAKIGKNLATVIPGLFLTTPRHKQDRLLFWKFAGNEYLESFVIPIEKTCERNRILSTGHYCIEAAGSEHIRQLGDRFDLKRHQGLPAVDMLGVEKFHTKDLLRMPGRDSLSVSIPGTACPAYFHKGSRVMCECMGLAEGWALDLAEIQRATGLLAILGIDIFVPHGIYYSVAGQRKWECGPDHLHNPMWEFYREWTDWIAKLSYLTSHGERASETALLYPANAQRAHVELGVEPASGKAHPTSDRGAVCDLIDFTWVAAGNALLENNIAYEIIDETLIQSGRVEAGKLLVRAANGTDLTFKVLVMPCPKVLEKATVERLRSWRVSGGGVIALNSDVEDIFDPATMTLEPAPEDLGLHDLRLDFDSESEFMAGYGPMLEFIRGRTAQPIELSGHAGKIVSKHWRKWGYDFCLLHNISCEAVNKVDVVWRGKDAVCRLNLETLSLEKLASDGFSFVWDFTPAQSLLLMSGVGLQAAECPRPGNISANFAVEGGWEFKAMKPNVLPLRSCVLEYRRQTKRHSYHFEVETVPSTIGLAVDCEMKEQELRFERYFNHTKRAFLNGTPVEGFKPGNVFDRWIFEADITELVKAGANELVLEISAGMLDENRSCETPMLFGDFAVLDDRIAIPPHRPVFGDWCAFGYPYYSGMGSYRKKIKLPAAFRSQRRACLSLGGLANAAELLVNGRSLERKILPPWEFDISSCLEAETLNLELRVINTAQNLWDAAPLPSGLFGPVEIRALA